VEPGDISTSCDQFKESEDFIIDFDASCKLRYDGVFAVQFVSDLIETWFDAGNLNGVVTFRNGTVSPLRHIPETLCLESVLGVLSNCEWLESFRDMCERMVSLSLDRVYSSVRVPDIASRNGFLIDPIKVAYMISSRLVSLQCGCSIPPWTSEIDELNSSDNEHVPLAKMTVLSGYLVLYHSICASSEVPNFRPELRGVLFSAITTPLELLNSLFNMSTVSYTNTFDYASFVSVDDLKHVFLKFASSYIDDIGIEHMKTYTVELQDVYTVSDYMQRAICSRNKNVKSFFSISLKRYEESPPTMLMGIAWAIRTLSISFDSPTWWAAVCEYSGTGDVVSFVNATSALVVIETQCTL